MQSWWLQAVAAVLAAVLSAPVQAPPTSEGAVRPVPGDELLSYHIEWRLAHAGNAQLKWSPSSGGLVSRLFKVDNDYSSLMSERLCIVSAVLRANEGSRKRETIAKFDAARRKASYSERDLVKNVTVSHEVDIQPCEHDVIGALYQLRTLRIEPGRSVEIPISDGKKAVMAKVEAQERETIKTDFGTYKTIRYEAYLMNNVLYRRRGRLFVWLTDDERRLPVQVRVRMPFYIGNVTLQLEKESKA
jgi:Protein of unknown function (DUF3108)